MGKADLILDLASGTIRDIEESNVLGFRIPRTPLNDIGDHRNGSPPKLRSEPEHFLLGKIARVFVNEDGQIFREFRGAQFGVISH